MPSRYPLSVKLDDAFDPTDADAAMTVAARSLKLLRLCSRVLFAERAGMKVGRDDSVRLAVTMRELGAAMGLIEDSPSGKDSDAFHQALEEEAGLR